MDIDITDISDNLNLTIENRFFLELNTHCLNQIAEKNLKFVLFSILKKFGKEELEPFIYSIIKELVINAVKANQKRIFFRENDLDIASEKDYSAGMSSFQKSLTGDKNGHYGNLCRDAGLNCRILINCSNNGILMEIINNTGITREEEISIREKLEKGMKYDDIAQYFFNHADEQEGAGIGLAMILIMLKNQGIDPAYFRIVPFADRTIARVEYPFNKNYKTVRTL